MHVCSHALKKTTFPWKKQTHLYHICIQPHRLCGGELQEPTPCCLWSPAGTFVMCNIFNFSHRPSLLFWGGEMQIGLYLPLALAISNLHVAISNFYQWQLTLIWPWYQAPWWKGKKLHCCPGHYTASLQKRKMSVSAMKRSARPQASRTSEEQKQKWLTFFLLRDGTVVDLKKGEGVEEETKT